MNKKILKNLGIFIIATSVISIVVFLILYFTKSYPAIDDQPTNSLQIINETSEDYLHVFLQTRDNKWDKLTGNGEIYPAIYWGKDAHAWDPIGALNMSEAIIPKNGNIILTLPPDMNSAAFRVAPLKLKDSKDKNPLTINDKHCDATLCRLEKQWPILLEGGKDVVADSSAVDGINFKMKYELTEKEGVKVMEIHKNPCEGLDQKYMMDIGCRNPAKVDCNGLSSCECCNKEDNKKGLCKLSNQDCYFNDCSQKLFNIPDNLKQFIGKYDGGNPNDVVKKWINKTDHLKKGTPLQSFCDNIQYNYGDFTAYCYDYNDVGSSPTLRSPYKMKVSYMDL
jgi:hypothetical protein